MKLAAAVLLAFLFQADTNQKAEPRYFHYERPVVSAGTGQSAAPACVVLDAAVFAHARAGLPDLRMFTGTGDAPAEVPYATTISETAATADAATLLNQGLRDGKVEFDLQMPARAYSEVRLETDAKDFLATARVTGMRTPNEEHGTDLGSFTLFDLSGQHLGRSLSLPLVEATFPYLHVELTVTSSPGHSTVATAGMITAAEVPPSREAQTIYTTVAKTTAFTQQGRLTVATIALPAHVPVERIRFELDPQDRTNFSRAVAVTVTGKPASRDAAPEQESIAGEISRVRMTQGGQEIRAEHLGVAATLGANSNADAEVKVTIENGDDKPVALRAVVLEMRERKLCFDQPATPVKLFYGDPELRAPVYDYARLYQPGSASQSATLGPESVNARYIGRDDTRTLTERHPEILWVALLLVVAVLGVVAFRSAKRFSRLAGESVRELHERSAD